VRAILTRKLDTQCRHTASRHHIRISEPSITRPLLITSTSRIVRAKARPRHRCRIPMHRGEFTTIPTMHAAVICATLAVVFARFSLTRVTWSCFFLDGRTQAFDGHTRANHGDKLTAGVEGAASGTYDDYDTPWDHSAKSIVPHTCDKPPCWVQITGIRPALTLLYPPVEGQRWLASLSDW
jgi:hypothetical protein